MSLVRSMKSITVEPVLFLYMFCTFMSFPLLQQLAYRKICKEHYNTSACNNLSDYQNEQNYVQTSTSNWMRYQALALALPSIASSLVLGAWSDRVGRKAIMILPPVGNILMNINYMLNVHFFSLNVNYLIIGIVIAGTFGGFATTLLSVFSYMADITDKSHRTLRISILESMVFLGGSVGELVAGVMLDHSGFMATFGLALGLNCCIAAYVTFILPESYFPNGQVSNQRCFLLEHLSTAAKVLFKRREGNSRLYLLVVLFGAMSVLLLNFGGFNDVIILYCLKEPLHLSSSILGYFLAEVFLIRGLGVVLGMPLMTKLLKLSDYIIALLGITFSCGMFIFFGLAKHKWMMFAGSMFAAVACLEVLYTLLASLIFNSVYSATVKWEPGFTFFLQAGILAIPAAVLVFLYLRQKSSCPYESMDTLVTAEHTQTPGFSSDPAEA
ncbi:solute carrier family 46 member 3 isoform X2 [Nematostella vectensis]|uniref:solute carrier family 46 member 3 isoform X2 n=1 Tax=Nematostella vectensis TaxID=45351 RepID=UPI00138FF9F2|nr:solute carrier family 46 member 3 isoform X2 [Nematostella vectensis]